MSPISAVHVAVGVIKNSCGEILISRRDESVHQGGLWEFPGGKVEPGESVRQALLRELREELNIEVNRASPLIKINYSYPDLDVLLDVWSVENFSGSIAPCEGQPLKWVTTRQLTDHRFPAANRPIIIAAGLSHRYAILEGADVAALRRNLQLILAKGIKLIQLRQKSLPASEIALFLGSARRICQQKGAQLLLNSAVANAFALAADGIHLTSLDLMSLTGRPPGIVRLAASCHTVEQLQQAENIGVDFAVLGPVKPTATHPGAKTLGWAMFANMVARINMPVFALGGMGGDDEEMCRRMGGHGIAGIRMFIDRE